MHGPPMTNTELRELIEYNLSGCNRHVNGVCHSAGCMKRGGWTIGYPVDDYVVATCKEYETATALQSYAARVEELEEALKMLFTSYKRLADSGDAGNWSLEDTDEGKAAIAAMAEFQSSL